MSLTAGWLPEDEWSKYIRMKGECLISNLVVFWEDAYVLDNGSEYKRYPRTKEGWIDLCEDLKGFEL